MSANEYFKKLQRRVKRMQDTGGADEARYIQRVITMHVHTCADGLCRPMYCYSCCQTKCEQHWNARSSYCNECETLLRSMHGYHVNGCTGCTKHRCWMCDRVLCVKAFPLTWRSRIIHDVCSDCLNSDKGQWYKQHFDRWVTSYLKPSERMRRQFRKDTHFSEEVTSSIKQIFDFKCAACHRHESVVKLTLDHVAPLVKDGSKEPENVQVLCLRCNASKSTKTIDYRTPEQIAKLKEIGRAGRDPGAVTA